MCSLELSSWFPSEIKSKTSLIVAVYVCEQVLIENKLSFQFVGISTTNFSFDRMDKSTKNDKQQKSSNVNDDAICLKPKMGLMNGINVIIGCMIGSGIFISPKGVLSGTGSVNMAIIVWLSSGIFSLIGSYCYAELGTMITKTGADYTYIMECFGPFIAFLRLWIECMIVRPCNTAIIALAFSFYTLRPFYPDCDPPGFAIRLLAIVCICMDLSI